MGNDLIFLHSAHYPVCTAQVDKHFSGYHTIQFMESGKVELFYDEEKYDLGEGGWLWTAFPGPRIRFHAARDASCWNHRYVAFTGSRINSWKNAGIWLHKAQPAPRCERNVALFDEILWNVNRNGLWSNRRAIHGIESLLLELCEAREIAPDEEWLRKTRDFLRLTEEFSPDYENFARSLGMGLSTLRRKYKNATGSSLHESLLQNRLEQARQLLIETDLPLKVIASQTGYQNVHFFSSQFKRMAGVSPGIYRRSRQN